MAEAARKTPEPRTNADAATIERLLRGLVASARQGASLAITGRPDARRWGELESVIDDLALAAQDTATARRLGAAIAAAASTEIGKLDPTGERLAAYTAMVEDLDRRQEAGMLTVPEESLTFHLHHTLLWYTAWHLLAADCSIPKTLKILGTGKRSAPFSPSLPTVNLPSVPWQALVNRSAQASAGALRVATAVSADLKVRSKRGFAAYQAAREERGRQAAVEKATLSLKTAHEFAAELAPSRTTPAASPERAPEPARPTTGQAETTSSPSLDARRLRGSVFGTWVMLVVLSWVSLFWGAMISLPFGIGFGILATAMAGIFAVPLWGTVFGFLGMGAARSATLRQMGFTEVTAGLLPNITAELAQKLDLPRPQVGTVPAFNAFAIGVDARNATVAIGDPLMKSLTLPELKAVIGHELGHIVSGDMRRMVLMRTFQNATVWFAVFQGLKQFTRWIICWAAELSILAFSRRREYWADAIGASLAGKEAMISALRKIENGPALSHAESVHVRFMFRGAFSTHPSTADRIRALEQETYLRRLPFKRD